ncbi:TetR/AcrR family transcriptional regulator [Paraferrimonas sedimenticola]|uniref:TetR family transcriptional regulator n=1 Tax=Paraferrimonas sedimenticola TaxID=375674 RepID=A0AA37W2E5_9GAMM|nr:TetR/AcrR family transcriptional regulator [Paraferrimonas sedimenticola]GLP97960.1 TetR family transcriptional regulator [Paraferrimonas sedimenticola]
MLARADTKHKILDAAERLFAERGFAETSLRAITSKADVNLASVNYHYGSKKELIRAVVARYLDIFIPKLIESLETLHQQHERPTLQQVFFGLVDPLLALDEHRHNGTSTFLQLLSRGFIENQGHLRWFITSHYGHGLDAFTKSVAIAEPTISKEEMFWRLHFTLGTVVFTMASSEALISIAENDFDEKIRIEDVILRVIPFVAAGVGRKAPTSTEGL